MLELIIPDDHNDFNNSPIYNFNKSDGGGGNFLNNMFTKNGADGWNLVWYTNAFMTGSREISFRIISIHSSDASGLVIGITNAEEALNPDLGNARSSVALNAAGFT